MHRGITLKVRFNYRNGYKRERIENLLKAKFPDYTIGISSIEPIIYINKLITIEEIEANIDFFTQCAIDYDVLATSLMNMLIEKYKLKVDWRLPFLTFANRKTKQRGKLNGWKYIRHGHHFRFENIKTKQVIEASIVCGEQFGELDPMFFSNYIVSTPQYHPLPVEIYETYSEGNRILDVMEKHNILKEIENNRGFKRHVLSIKDTSHIKFYIPKEVEFKRKFSLLRFLKLKK